MFGRLNSEVGREEALARLSAVLSGGGVVESAIKSARKSLGISQRRLAEVSGVSQAQLSRIETGTAALNDDAAKRLSAALKTNIGDLALAETLSQLSRKALKGELRPEVAVEAAVQLIEAEDGSEAGRRLTDTTLELLANIAETAAMKSRGRQQERRRRNHTGRVIQKPYDVEGGASANRQHAEEPRRDASGKRLNKPHGPGQRR